MKYRYIYKITNKINGKIYIGKRTSIKEPQFDRYMGSGIKIGLAIKKYGEENFNKDILEICESEEELNEKEKYYINLYNSLDDKIGYNIHLGGKGGNTGKRTEESKIRHSIIQKRTHPKGWMASVESRRRHGINYKGDNNPASYHNLGAEKIKEKAKKQSKTLKLKYKLGLIKHPLLGIGHTEKTKTKIKIWRKNLIDNHEILICPYCGKQNKDPANMKRWHFDRCKYKPKIIEEN